jgi:cysteinyl-tRNA synthetase
MLALVAERDAARAAKDFATSDRIRERLQDLGLEVMDSAEGTTIRRRA